ncbi:MAG: hypothetical protein AAGL49_13485, partial [Pseudomonadota bacterium]
PLALILLTAPVHVVIVLILIVMAAPRGELRPILTGLRDGIRALPSVWRDRRSVQRERRLTTPAVARMLTWSPRKLLKREADIRPFGAPRH